jgi:hypothetical protein
MLQPQRIAQTIVKLQQAGKRMPQDILPGFDRLEEAKRNLSETVNLWAGIFNQQNIGLDRWEKAEQIALTLTGANGLNVNIISPALMQAALKQAEEAHVQENINRCNMEKLSDGKPLADRLNGMLLKWTAAKLKEHRLIMPYMPQDKEDLEASSDPVFVLIGSIKLDEETRVYRGEDGKLLAIFGKGTMEWGAPGRGIWMVGTNELYNGYTKSLLFKEAKRVLNEWARQHGLLHNIVYEKNRTSINYLKHLGAIFLAEPKIGWDGKKFYQFYIPYRGE